MRAPYARHLSRALVAVLLLSPAAQAAVTSCTASAIGPAFGTYTPVQATPLNTTGSITTVCVVNSHSNSITIALNAGYSGNVNQREMTTLVVATTYTINYNLYQDAAYSTVWGDTGTQAETVTLTRHHGVNTITTVSTIYAQIPKLQDPAPGAYSDTITVTVTY